MWNGFYIAMCVNAYPDTCDVVVRAECTPNFLLPLAALVGKGLCSLKLCCLILTPIPCQSKETPYPGYESFYPLFFFKLRIILLLEIFKFIFLLKMYQSFKCMQVALVVMYLPADAGDRKMWVQSAGGEDPLEEGIATYSSVFGWRTPWTEEHGRLQSIESQGAGHD